jgi:DNA-binding winged helix-turn-helix (wHTH) protein
LEELSQAHSSGVREGALSKAEIIERVWGEKYRPDAHDNKLYYNINRLRKLIETDMKQPKYLQNWKEGYRLSPKLKVHWIGGEANAIRSTETH